jgi:hypothetical protein
MIGISVSSRGSYGELVSVGEVIGLSIAGVGLVGISVFLRLQMWKGLGRRRDDDK